MCAGDCEQVELPAENFLDAIENLSPGAESKLGDQPPRFEARNFNFADRPARVNFAQFAGSATPQSPLLPAFPLELASEGRESPV